MIDQRASVTDLNRFRARKRHSAGSRLGGRFAPASRGESRMDLASAADPPDPWGCPGFAPVNTAPKLTIVPAADDAGGPAPSTPAARSRGGFTRLPGKRDRDRLSVGLRTFAQDYTAGFGGSMEAALDTMDRLSADFARVAPCLPADQHRRLAAQAASRIIRHVDQHGSGGVTQIVQKCLDGAEQANRAAYDRGLRTPTRTGR